MSNVNHAKLSASGSYRWLQCPGSIKAEEGYPDTSSDHAREGSACHHVGEQCLLTGKNASEFVGQVIKEFDILITEDLANYVQMYVDYVRSLGGHLMVEQRVNFSNIVPDGFGTADAIVMVDDTLFIADLKMGKNQVVAENNSQAMLYALGVLNDYGFMFAPEKIVLVIVQPKNDMISEWEVPFATLNEFAVSAAKAARQALTKDAPRVPEEKACHYCKAKVECPALKIHIEKTIGAAFDCLNDLPSPDKLPLENISEVLKGKKLITSFLEAVEKFAMERLSNGESMPGFKLVAGRSNRTIADEDFAIRILHQTGYNDDQIFKPTALKTITELEKLMGKKEFALTLGDVVVKPEGAPTIAPNSDSRAPLSVVNASDFGC